MTRRSKIPAILNWVVLIFFYAPILLLVFTSFNGSKIVGNWGGFSLRWYEQLFCSREARNIWAALRNTLLVASIATVVSTILGTTSAIALHKYKGRIQNANYLLVYTPLVVPEILIGISMLLFFVNVHVQLGITTVIIAHITFCISYVTMAVLARLQDFDSTILEAAQDLGANNWQTTWKVFLPVIFPGVLSGALLAFTLSVDDYVISSFVAGPGSTTLPIHVYSMIRRGSLPMINALSTLLLAITFLIILAVQILGRKKKQAA